MNPNVGSASIYNTFYYNKRIYSLPLTGSDWHAAAATTAAASVAHLAGFFLSHSHSHSHSPVRTQRGSPRSELADCQRWPVCTRKLPNPAGKSET